MFTAYLLGVAPNRYVIEKYLEAHRVGMADSVGARFERLLGAVARAHPKLTRIADAYARIFLPASALRQKLVVLLAILESTPPFYHSLESVKRSSLTVHLLRLTGHGVTGIVGLLLGVLTLLPAHLLLSVFDRLGHAGRGRGG